TSDMAGRAETGREFVLLALPVAARVLAGGDTLVAAELPLLSQATLGGAAIDAISQSNMGQSLAAVALFRGSYIEAHMAWTAGLYSRCLDKGAPLGLRLTAWALLPLFCCYAGEECSAIKPRIAVDDPAELVEVVANVVGFVACARAGCLRIGSRRNDAAGGSEQQAASTYTVVRDAVSGACRPDGQVDVSAICGLYACAVCDGDEESAGESSGGGRGKVTLSDWLPYWFIASSRQHEATSVRFVRRAARFVAHAPAEEIRLRDSPLGQGIVRRLSSSSREIRLAAKDAILAYSLARASDSDGVTEAKLANRAETMRIVADGASGASIVDETLLLVAGGVGCAAQLGEPAMCEAMRLLVRYYCHSNIFLQAVAVEQLLCVSQVHGLSLGQLLGCFAENIASTLARTLDQPQPACFARCMAMLGTSAGQFLRRYQDEIVPALFIDGNEAALKRVAELAEVQLPVFCVNQAAAIFARIFMMDDRPMQDAMTRFVGLLSAESELDKDQVEINIPSLLRSCSAKLVFSLVLALGDDDRTLRRRARSSLATVQCIVDSAVAGNAGEGDGQGQGQGQGIATIVQQSAANMKSIATDESPRTGQQRQRPPPGAELARFLSRHILGVLAYMNELLRESEALPAQGAAASIAAGRSERTQRTALRAIGELVALLGAEAAPHANGIVASLAPALGGPLSPTALEAWVALAESLAPAQLSADQLNALIVPLVAAFVAADGETRRLVAAAVERVVELHEDGVRAHHAQLCPIPDDPLLAGSHALVQRLAGGDRNLRARLAGLAELLRAREPTTVLCAARAMSALLQAHGKQVAAWKQPFSPGGGVGRLAADLDGSWAPHGHGSGGAQSDAAFVGSLVEALRAASSVGGPLGEAAAANCAACLAAIGVVDGRALLEDGDLAGGDLRGMGSAMPALHDLDDDDDERVEFICTLIIDYLSRAFVMAPSPSAQMCTAYGIQELLRLAGFTGSLLADGAGGGDIGGRRRKTDPPRPGKAAERGVWLRQRWAMLPPNVVDVIRPLLESKYTIHHATRPPPAAPAAREPCIAAAASYAGWLRAWVVELVGALSESPAARLFKACLSTIKEGPVDLVRFILPHVAHQYCLQRRGCPATDNAEPILIKDSDCDDVASDSEAVPRPDAAMAVVVVSELQAVLSCDAGGAAMAADQLRMCKVAALELLDACSSHVRVQQAARTAGKRSSRSDTKPKNAPPAERALLAVVEAMPLQTVARAAADCGQYERAILYSELGLREGARGSHPTLFGNVDDAAIAAVQELYFGMGDADGVAGAALCRKQADHRLTIRRHQIEGNWSHALIGHESLLRLDPDSETARIGWIECLQNMGQWEGAWAASQGFYNGSDMRTDAEHRLGSACYAAAWRLGKWNWIQHTAHHDTAALTRAGFDAVNSALLLRLGRCSGAELRGLVLPLPLHMRNLGAGGAADASLASLADMALRVTGRDIAQESSSRHPAAPGEIHAHMLGDMALLGTHLADVLLSPDSPSHDCGPLSAALGTLLEQWRARVACLPPLYSAQEPVLALHARVLDMLLGRLRGTSEATGSGDGCVCAGMLSRQAVQTRLQAAQLACLARNRATALGILTYAELACAAVPALLAPLQIEQAQILWDEGHATDAIATIRRVADGLSARLDVVNGSDGDGEPGGPQPAAAAAPHACLSLADISDTRAAFARASLLLSRWQEVTSSVSSVQLLAQYEKILRVQESDKAHYALAQLYDSLFTTMTERDAGSRTPKPQADHRCLQLATLQYYVVRHYSRTVVYSSRFLYRALPRLLTVWLDFGANILRPVDAKNTRMVDRFKTANRVIGNLAKRLPAYYFLVVLSQLVSRICHPNEDVFAVLEAIILRVLEQYPQQALWQLIGVQRSTYAERAERCNAVLAKARALHAVEPAA
ncbi:hypothetical protein H4R19_002612, partial [Coemansia spiralis]